MILVLVGFTLVFLLLFIFVGNRPHTEVKLGGGRATLVRGSLPGGLINDLGDIAKRSGAAGRVVLKGQGDTLAVSGTGLDDRTAQHVRNVVVAYRNQIQP